MRIRVDPGLEYLLPFAKKKLNELIAQKQPGNAPLTRNLFGDGFQIYLQAGPFPELRITGGTAELLFSGLTLTDAPALQSSALLTPQEESIGWQFYQELAAQQPDIVISVQGVVPLQEVLALSQQSNNWLLEYGMALTDAQSFVIQSGSGSYKNFLDPALNTPPRTTGSIEWLEGSVQENWPPAFRAGKLLPNLDFSLMTTLANSLSGFAEVDGATVTAYSLDYLMRGQRGAESSERRSAGYYASQNRPIPAGFSVRMIGVRLLAAHQYVLQQASDGAVSAELLRSSVHGDDIDVTDLLALPGQFDMHMGPIAFVLRPRRLLPGTRSHPNDMRQARDPLTVENPALFDVHSKIIKRIRQFTR